MQFTTFIYTAIMAATSISALPNIEARQADVIGRADVYPRTGCQPRFNPSVPQLGLTAGGICNQFPAPSVAVNVTALNNGCTLLLFTDSGCASSSVITLPTPGTPAGGLNQCEEGAPGIHSYKATCA
ncbi:uncharacterized protein BP5553_02019 [Venustampulla echinocandica]|uniref:Uncharacterized protein n=1 Tax=Venustampulla echinocandica TaxID=2656787 RepID=A0A370U2N6_9HELO|nr:uncharacterized protein BP5553_02019 [Venustampulla echinocandica]RDL42040.1 hypothetical protein BP5553_02019 [Venustampulla echinocandica]